MDGTECPCCVCWAFGIERLFSFQCSDGWRERDRENACGEGGGGRVGGWGVGGGRGGHAVEEGVCQDVREGGREEGMWM